MTIRTFAPGVPTPIAVGGFCQRIILEISRQLLGSVSAWSQVYGVGISWPGAVRDQRVVGVSQVLTKLKVGDGSVGYASHPQMIQALDFCGSFRQALTEISGKSDFNLRSDLVATIVNDGDAEAFGNYCLRLLSGGSKPCGRVVVKLGTSLAGGRIDASGAVVTEVAEFSKVVMAMPDSPRQWEEGTARGFVSSLGVRNLTRTFLWPDAAPLFGERAGLNVEANGRNKIEAVELGKLLALFVAAKLDDAFLDSLVTQDNRMLSETSVAAASQLEGALAKDSRALINQAIPRFCPEPGKAADPPVGTPWQVGMGRLVWLVTGQSLDTANLADGEWPVDLSLSDLANCIVGTAALFSELGLRVAHLLASLYNVYGRHTFKEVILAGGVLSGETGKVVRRQTERFLLKYYDKIYGPDRPVPQGALIFADASQLGAGAPISMIGPFGAAMLANRRHKLEALRQLRRYIYRVVADLTPGQTLTVADVQNGTLHLRVAENEIRAGLKRLMLGGKLLPSNDTPDTFVRGIHSVHGPS